MKNKINNINPLFYFYVIYNKKEKAYHKGGKMCFKKATFITTAMMYNSFDLARNALISIIKYSKNENLEDYIIIKYFIKEEETYSIKE